MSPQSTSSPRIRKSRRPSAAMALGLRGTPKRNKSPPSDKGFGDHDHDAQLEDAGLASLAHDLDFSDVPQFIQYIRSSMFSDIPGRGGISSTRRAEILNHRKRLPPFVTMAHVDALTASSTATERDIAQLAHAGIVKRVTIPHRGLGAAAVGEGIALLQDWQQLIRSNEILSEELKNKYISSIRATSASSAISCATFTADDIRALVDTGFLTTPNVINTYPPLAASADTYSLTTISTAGARHAAGSLDAVGGVYAREQIHGGTSLASSRTVAASTFNFSLPNVGAYTKLIVGARTHLLSILNKTKYKQMPLYVLRERWNGGPAAETEQRERKKLCGEFAGILPGRTRKWKQFYGLRFEWIVEECVGAGVIELFETGSVGRAARVTS